MKVSFEDAVVGFGLVLYIVALIFFIGKASVPEPVRGDLNGDGKVTLTDLVILKEILMEHEEAP